MKPQLKEKAVDLIDLTTATLPKLELSWREFRLDDGKKTRTWAIAVEPDGASFRTREQTAKGGIRESSSIRPGERGRPGSKTYLSAEKACWIEVERRIQRRLKDGYGEFVKGQVVKSNLGIDFSKPFPKTIRTPKPEQLISDSEFRRLHEEKLTRVTRKYDGMGLVVVHHTYGWEAYTLHGNRVTDFFPKHMEALGRLPFKAGTILKAEAVVFNPREPRREDFGLMNRTFAPTRNWQAVRSEVESGQVPEPAFVFYDILYKDGLELRDASYDQRKKYWEKFPVARAENGLLLSAEFFKATPDNWRRLREKLGFEGFVVVDGSSVLGKKVVSFSTNPPRPKGSYKLKPNMEEDVVVYAVRKVDGVYESVFVKQRYPDCYPGTSRPHPKAGQWFASGRVSILGMKDVLKKVDDLVQQGKIRVVSNNRDGERIEVDNDSGVVGVIEFFDRFPSNKFRHPKFVQPVRFRCDGADFKSPAECAAHYLGEPLPANVRTASRGAARSTAQIVIPPANARQKPQHLSLTPKLPAIPVPRIAARTRTTEAERAQRSVRL